MDTRFFIIGFSAFCMMLATGASAQPAEQGAQPAEKPEAAAEWRAIMTLAAGTAKAEGKRLAAQVAKDRELRASQLHQIARQAKAFHATHPASENAGRARLLEVTAALESVRLGRRDMEAAALASAAAFRADRGNSLSDRFEVAVEMERHGLRKKLGGKSPHESPADYEAVADTLHREFGEIPEVYALYATIASSADAESANRIATKILEMPATPSAKTAADDILSRYGLLGRRLDIQLTATDGNAVQFEGASGLSTVIYVSSARESSRLYEGLSRIRARVPQDATWVYLQLGVERAESEKGRAKAPFPGVHCIEPAGLGSAVAKRLKIAATPYVYVLDRHGVLVGFGPPGDLPRLLSNADRKEARP